MVELVDRLVKQGELKLTKPVPMTVTYHDPCHLGRQGEPLRALERQEKKIFGQAVVYDPPRPRYNGAYGVYEPPRDVLQAIPGLEARRDGAHPRGGLVLRRRRRRAGGLPRVLGLDGGERIEEAAATGAEAIVTACPWCEQNFDDAVEQAAAGAARSSTSWPSSERPSVIEEEA